MKDYFKIGNSAVKFESHIWIQIDLNSQIYGFVTWTNCLTLLRIQLEISEYIMQIYKPSAWYI